jgi:AraC-like DNA-binding protein
MKEVDKIDQLSEVFSTLRIGSGIYFRADLRGEFAVAVPADNRLIRFHHVRRGQCLIGLEGREEWVELREGDMAIVPNGATHILADRSHRKPVPLADIIASGALGEDGVLTAGDGEGRVELLCGFCRFDEDIDHPVVAHLPELVVLKTADIGHEPWIVSTLRLLELEADLGGQGMNGVLGRLLEILFIQTVRREMAGSAGSGYMAALADPNLSKALLAIHRAPETDWTISALAREAAMSRARFSARFTEMTGVPPIRYLTTWRLMKARHMLRETDLSIGEIALRCGYASLASFTRRYTAAFGLGPGAYRRAERFR